MPITNKTEQKWYEEMKRDFPHLPDNVFIDAIDVQRNNPNFFTDLKKGKIKSKKNDIKRTDAPPSLLEGYVTVELPEGYVDEKTGLRKIENVRIEDVKPLWVTDPHAGTAFGNRTGCYSLSGVVAGGETPKISDDNYIV